MKRSIIDRVGIPLALVLAFALAACGSGGATDTTAGSDEPEVTDAAPDTTEAATDTTEAGTDTTEAATDTTAGEEPAGDLPVVRLSALNGGLTGVALTAIEENGFDEANGFTGEFFYNDADASGQFFLQGNSDIAFDYDAIGAAIARTEGLDVSVFYPLLNNNNCILVPEGSEHDSPEDLVGLNVGHFGADSGTTTSFAIVLNELFGINPLEDYNLVETGPPALVELLQDGEVEAIFNFVPHSSRAMVQVPAECMFGPLHTVVQDMPGEAFSHLSAMAAYDEWLDENEELAQSVMAAWDDAYEWITEDPTRITGEPYISLLGQDDEAVLELIAQQVPDIPIFTNDWSPEVQASVEAWVDLAAEQDVLIEENPGGVVRSIGS
jgi:NitT/TauT family transport system substrate-binding protein